MDVKMKDLKAVVEELNKVLNLEPELKVKVGMTKVAVIKDIQEAAELLTLEDKLSEKTTHFLDAIHANLDVPQPEKDLVDSPPPEQATPKEQAAPDKAKSTKPPKAVEKKAEKFTRAHAFGLALSELGKEGCTKKELMVKANEIYVGNGGDSNAKQGNTTKIMLTPMIILGVITELEGKFYLTI